VTPGVVRVGKTVRRPPGANAELVRRLLRLLEVCGFNEAPRYLGVDDRGREMLSFHGGDVPSDCRSLVWRDEQLRASAALLRRFHDATAGSDLARDREVVCHNDFGPWNLVWRDGRPVAIIDFDNAAPGKRLDDLGYAIWKHLNLGLIDLPAGEQGRRLHVMTAAYDVAADDAVLSAIEDAQRRMAELIEAAPASPKRDEDRRQIASEVEWMRVNRSELLAS
jgi:hypothetical protein